jgi:hypothetical protein
MLLIYTVVTVELRKITHYWNQLMLAICGLIRRVSFKVTDAITRFRDQQPGMTPNAIALSLCTLRTMNQMIPSSDAVVC